MVLALLRSMCLATVAAGQDFFLSAASRPPSNASQWDVLRQLLQGWEFTTEYAITIGTAEHGRLFTYEGGNFTLKMQIPTGSTSKWPSAMMIAGLVEDGTIRSLDEPVSSYFSWWTKNTSDSRSRVTLRTLLSFTSGFGGGSPGEEANTRAARDWRSKNGVQRKRQPQDDPELPSPCNTTVGDIVDCAKAIYDTVEVIGEPGKVYSYNSNHLQIAAALAVVASGLDIQAVVAKYLTQPYNMSDSFYQGKCPDFAGSLVTTGDDYERFLQGVLGYKPLSMKLVAESEKDYTPFQGDQYSLYGHYGFGHFLACFDSVRGFTEQCRKDRVHMDPGAFGFIPMIDRKYGYYMQLVAAEISPWGSYPLSGIPEYLAVAIKPVVDAIMSARPPSPDDYMFHTPEYLSLSVADVNYCLQCRLYPDSCL